MLCQTERKKKAKNGRKGNSVSFSNDSNKFTPKFKSDQRKIGLNHTFIYNNRNTHNNIDNINNKYVRKIERYESAIQQLKAELSACNKLLNKKKPMKPMKPFRLTTKILNSHSLSNAGYDINQEQKTNQDRISFLDISSSSSSSFAMAVADGHGKQGEKVSRFVIDYLKEHIASINFSADKSYASSLIDLFKSCQTELTNTKTIPRKQSGTTVTCAFIVDNKVILANIGDSRSVVFAFAKNKIIFETNAHTLSVPSEKERIVNCPKAEVTAIVDRESGKKIGPERIFAKGKDGPGIMMTRSIGDVDAHELGVLDEAEVSERELEEGEYAVIAASDGLWDKVSDMEVCEVVKKHYRNMDVRNIVGELADIAEQKWRDTDDVVDDITIGIVLFQVKKGESKKVKHKK